MSALTTAPATHHLRTTVSLRTLTSREQGLFDRTLHAADQATNVWHIKDIHQLTAAALGIHLSPNGELVQCSCHNCPDYCDALFDLNDAHVYLDGTIQRPQCPACTDDHRAEAA